MQNEWRKGDDMKRRVLMIGAVAIIILAIGIGATIYFLQKNELIYVEMISNQVLPDVTVTNMDGTENTLIDLCKASKKEKTLLLYLSDTCENCMMGLDTISVLSNVESLPYDVTIVWDNQIPERTLTAKKMKREIHYSLNSEYDFERNKPCGYVIQNQSGIIELKANYIESILSEVIKSVDVEDVKHTFESIWNLNKDSVMVFTTYGCEACETAKTKLNEQESNQNVFYISDVQDLTTNFLDYYKLIQNVYGVTDYPTFLTPGTKENYGNLEDYLDAISNLVH